MYYSDEFTEINDEYIDTMNKLVYTFQVVKDHRDFNVIFTGKVKNVCRLQEGKEKSNFKLEVANVNWVPLMLKTLNTLYNIEINR